MNKLNYQDPRGGVGCVCGEGVWLIRISSNRDKYFDFPGFFWVGKSGKYFF